MRNFSNLKASVLEASPKDIAQKLILSTTQPQKNCGQGLITLYIEKQRWDILGELQSLLRQPPPYELASTSPRKFKAWMHAVTECYLLGWDKIIPPQPNQTYRP